MMTTGSGYQAGIKEILIHFTNSTDPSATDTINGSKTLNQDAITYALSQTLLNSPQGDLYYFNIILVYQSNYTNSSGPVISRINPDDDNDSIDDEDDTCPQGQTDWMSNSSSDTDGDGCRDHDEDDNLAGVTQLTAIPAPTEVSLQWINPNVFLRHINISWVEEGDSMSGSHRINQPLLPLGRLNTIITNLAPETNWTFSVQAHYENGGTSMPPAIIIVQTGENHDNDSQANSLDPDDDNDDIDDENDSCPRGQTGWMSTVSTDTDNDGCRDDTEDSDDDNDGLMEIDFLEELAALRNDLNGDGMDDSSSITSSGCPAINGCYGFELRRDLDFKDPDSYRSGEMNTNWTGGNGWRPIGNGATMFSGNFDGNDRTLAHLFINGTENNLGLFGVISGKVSNLNLRDAEVYGNSSVGMLVGMSSGGQFLNITVQGIVNATKNDAGGLIGSGENSFILLSFVSSSTINASTANGGLIGQAENINISFSAVLDTTITGAQAAGGLIGSGENSFILSSFVGSSAINASTASGGLIGYDTSPLIISSYITAGSRVSGDEFIGGLLGQATNVSIHNSYAASLIQNTTNQTGGLIGGLKRTDGLVNITFSYWDKNSTAIQQGSFGAEKTTQELQAPTGFTGIYAHWNISDIRGEMDDRTQWCDTNLDGRIDSEEMRADNRLWNFGNIMEYPALVCAPLSPAVQRTEP